MNRAHGADLVKIAFDLGDDTLRPGEVETMWAEPLGEDRYRLRNSPFYARGFSFLDVVIAERQTDGFPVVRRPLVRSGHSTYQLVVPGGIDASADFRSYAARLLELRRTFERATAQLAAVDVPPEANIHEVYGLLEAGEQAGVWDFQEGYCGHAV
jgi:Domain of unknown function (DUF4265)